tara:strand:+ start:571 stop:744 length:174 start_codon:yes stop_codon:yes gene_type:complete
MKTITINTTWHAYDTIEVSDEDYDLIMENPDNLTNWPMEFCEQFDASGAELVDWDLS